MSAAKICQLSPLGLSFQHFDCNDEWFYSETESDFEEFHDHIQWQASMDEAYQLHVASVLSILSNLRPASAPTATAPSHLLPHLYLGDGQHAMDQQLLANEGIDCIVNCATSSTLTSESFYPPSFSFHGLDALDQPDYDILSSHFDDFFNFVEHCRQQNRSVLVHCQAGINRSAVLCVAYYMIATQTPLLQAVEQVARLRPVILTNEGFIEQLVVFASDHDLLE